MTGDNYIIFNNLIIGQTANDHSVDVNMRGRRIELQFRLIRLLMWCVCVCVSVYYVCTLIHTVQMKEGKQMTEKQAVELSELLRNEEEALKYCFLCLLPSFNTGSESVLLNSPSPVCVCVYRDLNTHTDTCTG